MQRAIAISYYTYGDGALHSNLIICTILAWFIERPATVHVLLAHLVSFYQFNCSLRAIDRVSSRECPGRVWPLMDDDRWFILTLPRWWFVLVMFEDQGHRPRSLEETIAQHLLGMADRGAVRAENKLSGKADLDLKLRIGNKSRVIFRSAKMSLKWSVRPWVRAFPFELVWRQFGVSTFPSENCRCVCCQGNSAAEETCHSTAGPGCHCFRRPLAADPCTSHCRTDSRISRREVPMVWGACTR